MMKTYAFGVDIGGTTIKMGLFTTNGDLLDSWEIPTRTESDGSYILPDIAEAVENKLNERDISKLDVEGIGIGVPGPVGPDAAEAGESGCVDFAINARELYRIMVRTGSEPNPKRVAEFAKLPAAELDPLLRDIALQVYAKHNVAMTGISIYSVNTSIGRID